MEQVRIVKEMRDADGTRGISDDLRRPRYMVWENVPGAFSSAAGEDFRAVLQEIIRIADCSCDVPRPDTGRWESAGAAILGKRCSVAWRVLDAQYWGVPSVAVGSSLSQILEDSPPQKYYLSRNACLGILRRAKVRGKELPPQLETALRDSGGSRVAEEKQVDIFAFHINQREETINLNGISGALMATTNMQMQTFCGRGDEEV